MTDASREYAGWTVKGGAMQAQTAALIQLYYGRKRAKEVLPSCLLASSQEDAERHVAGGLSVQ